MSLDKISIVNAIQLTSIAALVPLSDKYPELKELLAGSKSTDPAADWDYFMTAAGSGLVLTSPETHSGERNSIRKRLVEIDKSLLDAVDDFTKFINKFEGKDELVSSNAGLWVLWNVKQAEPTYSETKVLGPMIGNFLTKAISDWRAANSYK